MRPDWSASPEWANYASQELSGSWYWHETQPRFQELTGEWISKGQRQIVPKVSVSAKDTLEPRPRVGLYGFYVPDSAIHQRTLEQRNAQQE